MGETGPTALKSARFRDKSRCLRADPPNVTDPSQAAKELGCLFEIQNLLQMPGPLVLGAQKKGVCVCAWSPGGGLHCLSPSLRKAQVISSWKIVF